LIEDGLYVVARASSRVVLLARRVKISGEVLLLLLGRVLLIRARSLLLLLLFQGNLTKVLVIVIIIIVARGELLPLIAAAGL
jgi:hypothetical protein